MLLSLGSLELVMDNWLGTGLDASNIISHWIEASFGGVDLDNLLQLGLASLQFLFPVFAMWLAFFKNEWFRVLSLLKHG